MSLRYSYSISANVVSHLTTLRARQRDELLRIFDTLADNPFVKGDRIQHDDCGRPMQVKRYRRWEVTFWLDHLACEVRVVNLSHLH